MEIIAKASEKEEILGDPSATAITAEPPRPREKKEPVPFTYKMDKKGLTVPGFKWKPGQGNEKLQDYAEALKKLIFEIEEKLTNPSA
ncbi:MAG: hypothetical protein A2583_10595 [Bdellovibrionales bacterium RIFOXYD1_FULL_53_11]|nr:MAG: hypothetical protein A2583_10595 [Bdellovibrionales bacterium RIFOXYD1_FULL_53_11]